MLMWGLAALLFLGGLVYALVSGNWGIGAIVFSLGDIRVSEKITLLGSSVSEKHPVVYQKRPSVLKNAFACSAKSGSSDAPLHNRSHDR